jgi:hypothetical protein
MITPPQNNLDQQIDEIRSMLKEAINSNAILRSFLQATNNYDKILEYAPRSIHLHLQTDEGKEILKGIGILSHFINE